MTNQTDEGAYLPTPEEIARVATILRRRHYAAKRENNNKPKRKRKSQSEKVWIPRHVDHEV